MQTALRAVSAPDDNNNNKLYLFNAEYNFFEVERCIAAVYIFHAIY